VPVLLLLVGATAGAEYGGAQLRLDTDQHRVALDFLRAANSEVIHPFLIGLDLIVIFFLVAATEWAYRALRAAAGRAVLPLRANKKPEGWAIKAAFLAWALALAAAWPLWLPVL
jgi:hypothetical protein